ncbi:MAG: hypothetical protein KDD82_23850 [Planctomycetes bacterium]|nr:hypothetical protein [Planctomycetota bacterium]
MRNLAWVGVCLIGTLGCSGGSSRGGASTAAAVTSGQTSSTSSSQPAAGPLHQKALGFETTLQAQHVPHGQVQDVLIDPNGNVVRTGGAPSRCLWTGVYAATQAMRFQATGDPQALAQMETACWTLHDLATITGYPGVIVRGYDDAAIESRGYPGTGAYAGLNYNQGKPSRDQYAGWFYGVGAAFDLIQDPALRQALEADVRAVCDLLIAKDMVLEAPWGPQGTLERFFTLAPDYFYQDRINPQSWATVDDFPFNLIARSVPYSPQVAQALRSAPYPKIRAGEGLRGLFFFTVAEHMTGDPRYTQWKQTLIQRGYVEALDKFGTIGDDLLYGKNMAAVEEAVRDLSNVLAVVLQVWLSNQGTLGGVVSQLLPLATPQISAWIASSVVRLLNWLHDPNNQQRLQAILNDVRLFSQVLNLIGQQSLAQQIDGFLAQYGSNLTQQGLIDLARTIRSHLGVNLSFMPLSLMVQFETDPQLLASYKTAMHRSWEYLATDHNPVVNLLHHGYSQTGADDVGHSIQALKNFHDDMSMREIDNSGWPGLVVSPWPDRFGRVGNHAIQPLYFPVDARAPDIFVWRGHPRQIKSGANQPDLKVAPLSYLYPYWLARHLGVIGPAD